MKKIVLFLLILPLYLTAAERVTSLSPALTHLIILLGGESALCGRSSACSFPEVSCVPIVGDLGRPFPEAVLSVRPDTVVCDAAHPEANWEILRRCGVRIESFSTENISCLPENLRRLGRLTGREETAEKMALEVERKLAALRTAPPSRRCRAAVLFGVSPLISCGRDVYISDILSLVGIDNIAGTAGNKYFILSPEFLYQENPEWILTIGIPESAAQQVFQYGLLRNLPAVKCGRIIALDAEKWSRLTPEVIEAAEKLRHELGY